MAKLPRIFQNLFGQNGNQAHFGQFGSRAAGSPFTTKDPASIQSLPAFIQQGWLDAINAANKAPFLEDMNGLFLLLFYQIAYGFQEGIPEWNAGTTYFTGSIVKKAGTTEQYGSAVDNNTGNALPSQTSNGFWNYLNPQTVPSGVMADFGGAVAPFGWLACDGSEVAQASYPALFLAIGSTWNTFNGNAAPAAGNFRLPDMRGQITMGVGAGNGLTPRTLAQNPGSETVTLSVGQMPSHNHGVTDPTHSHVQRTYSSPAGGDQASGGSASVPGGTTFNAAHPNGTAASSTGISINNTGGDGSHPNVQPSAVVTKIIKI